jgi:hypothetical protein
MEKELEKLGKVQKKTDTLAKTMYKMTEYRKFAQSLKGHARKYS